MPSSVIPTGSAAAFWQSRPGLLSGQIGEVTSVVTRGVHEPDGSDSDHPTHRPTPEPDPDGGLGHPQPGYEHVADGRQKPGFGICTIGDKALAKYGTKDATFGFLPWMTARFTA